MLRLIFCIEFDVLDPKKPEALTSLIAWLRPDGTSQYITPLLPKTKTVELRTGDWFLHAGGRYQVRGIRAYRENVIPDDYFVMGSEPLEGYLVRVTDDAA